MARVSDQLKGMGMGGLFLALFGGFWMVAALNDQTFVWIATCVLLPGSLLVIRSISILLTARQARSLEPPITAEDAAQARGIGRQFGLVFMLEFGLIAVAANLLAHYHRMDWILPAIALIVGAHFLPLARVFHYSLYYFTGGIEIAASLGIGWGMRAHPAAAEAVLGLVMGLSLWLTALILMVQASWMSRAAGVPRG